MFLGSSWSPWNCFSPFCVSLFLSWSRFPSHTPWTSLRHSLQISSLIFWCHLSHFAGIWIILMPWCLLSSFCLWFLLDSEFYTCEKCILFGSKGKSMRLWELFIFKNQPTSFSVHLCLPYFILSHGPSPHPQPSCS